MQWLAQRRSERRRWSASAVLAAVGLTLGVVGVAPALADRPTPFCVVEGDRSAGTIAVVWDGARDGLEMILTWEAEDGALVPHLDGSGAEVIVHGPAGRWDGPAAPGSAPVAYHLWSDPGAGGGDLPCGVVVGVGAADPGASPPVDLAGTLCWADAGPGAEAVVLSWDGAPDGAPLGAAWKAPDGVWQPVATGLDDRIGEGPTGSWEGPPAPAEGPVAYYLHSPGDEAGEVPCAVLVAAPGGPAPDPTAALTPGPVPTAAATVAPTVPAPDPTLEPTVAPPPTDSPDTGSGATSAPGGDALLSARIRVDCDRDEVAVTITNDGEAAGDVAVTWAPRFQAFTLGPGATEVVSFALEPWLEEVTASSNGAVLARWTVPGETCAAATALGASSDSGGPSSGSGGVLVASLPDDVSAAPTLGADSGGTNTAALVGAALTTVGAGWLAFSALRVRRSGTTA